MAKKLKVYMSCGNVFKDLGLPNPERIMARAQIMDRITEIIQERILTQKQTAKILGIPQSKVSCLMNGKLHMFSLDHLFELLNKLDKSVHIFIKPKAKGEKTATTHVHMKAA